MTKTFQYKAIIIIMLINFIAERITFNNNKLRYKI